MNFEVLADSDAVAQRAAAIIAEHARVAVEDRGRFVLAVSGGRTPWVMLRGLVNEAVPWKQVHLAQVDERIAPAGHADRNLTHIRDNLTSRVAIPPEQIYAMPVEATDLQVAAESYARTLTQFADSPAILDLIHLGMGADGHTASLLPGDPGLNVTNCDVALTSEYQGRRRMTLTYPIINRARCLLWVVTGGEKSGPLAQLQRADHAIPAGRVNQQRALVLADSVAAEQLDR